MPLAGLAFLRCFILILGWWVQHFTIDFIFYDGGWWWWGSLHGNRDVRREVRPNVSLQRPWSPGSKPPSPSPQPSAPPSKAIPCHLHQPSYHDKCKATLLHFQVYLIFVNFVTPPQIFSPVNQKYTKKHTHRSPLSSAMLSGRYFLVHILHYHVRDEWSFVSYVCCFMWKIKKEFEIS